MPKQQGIFQAVVTALGEKPSEREVLIVLLGFFVIIPIHFTLVFSVIGRLPPEHWAWMFFAALYLLLDTLVLVVTIMRVRERDH